MKYTREQVEEEILVGENRGGYTSRAASAMLRQLLAENDALREDAERYRWLRDTPITYDTLPEEWQQSIERRGSLDAAIDAARQKY